MNVPQLFVVGRPETLNQGMPYHVLPGVELGMRLGRHISRLRYSKETIP
eukprot:COSAG01_NODE_26487_length_712_cov_1.464927_1_plen_48_part_01